MSSSHGPGGLAAAFFRSCLYVFAGVVLLVWAVELACRYWWVLVLGAGAAFHLAHQYRAQLSPQMIQAIETNARNKIYFSLSGTDAAASARLAPGLEAADFQLLGRYRAYAHLIHRGRPTDWFTIATEPAPPPLRDPADLYAASHTRYGVPAQTTETELLHLIDPPPERAGDRTPAPIGRIRR